MHVPLVDVTKNMGKFHWDFLKHPPPNLCRIVFISFDSVKAPLKKNKNYQNILIKIWRNFINNTIISYAPPYDIMQFQEFIYS